MPLIQIIVLAILQGITEFLPISSTAHLILAPALVEGWADQGLLIDIAGHVGTLLAVLAYFRSETMMLLRGGVDALRFRASADRRLFLFIAGATVPIVLAGAVFEKMGWEEAMRSPTLIGWTSIIFGGVLYIADRAPVRIEGLASLSWFRALAIGFAQVLAIIPGVSRSGITMTAARSLGFSRTEAARFSMLLAIPTIAAVGLYGGVEIARQGPDGEWRDAAIMAAISFAVAYATIAALMRLTRSVSFTPFVIYRILLGAGLLILAPGAA